MLLPLLLLACADAPPPQTPAGPPRGPPPQQSGFHATPTFELEELRASSSHPLVIISLDTVRADHLAVYGGRAETPNLTALAARGARFDQAIVHFPETALSHWSMLSGILPEVHGNVPAHGGSLYRGPTAAEIAKKSGYATAAFIGGITLTDASSGLARGYDLSEDRCQIDPKDMRRPGSEVAAAAARWISAQKGPYFAFVHFFDAHFPYTPDPPWDTRYDPDYVGSLDGSDTALRPYRDEGKEIDPRDLAHVVALYDGELSELDATLAPLLAAIPEDAVVVLTADHGESFEHGYLFNHRAGLWDGVLHVPLLIAGPGVSAGTVVEPQVGEIDLLPTALDLAGLPRDRRMQGESRVGLLSGTGDGRAQVFAITDPWMEDPQWAVRSADSKVILRGPGVWGYDLRTDPLEEHPADLVPPWEAAQAEYKALIAALAAEQVEAPAPRGIGPDQAHQLQVLGYVAPGGPPPPKR